MTIAEFIGRLGGHVKVADRLGITRQAVYLWEKTGHIPWRHHLELETWAKELGIGVRVADIAAMGRGKGKANG